MGDGYDEDINSSASPGIWMQIIIAVAMITVIFAIAANLHCASKSTKDSPAPTTEGDDS